MPIPQLNAWRSATGFLSLNVGRGNAVGGIDDQIRAYWAAGTTADPAAARQDALVAMRKACRHWLKAHPTTNSKMQRAIADLEVQADNELRANVPGWATFADAKAAGRGAQLKAMAPGYAHERRMFEAEGKQRNPISASALRDAAMNPGDNPHQVITNMDDATWDQHAAAARRMGSKQDEVVFFDKVERLEHLLVCAGGQLRWARDNSLFNTPGGPFMYAMDGYGNLFARSDQMGATQFNHSSFNAGREVVCAGMIAARNGRLEFISNESGHYQPTPLDLFSCVKRLRDAGVAMDFLRLIGGAGGGRAYTRVRALGVGDWPAKSHGAVRGFDHVGHVTQAPPAPIPNPPTFGLW